MTSISSFYPKSSLSNDQKAQEASEISNNHQDDNSGYLVLTFSNNSSQSSNKIPIIRPVRATTRLTARLTNSVVVEQTNSPDPDAKSENNDAGYSYSSVISSSEAASFVSSSSSVMTKTLNHYKHYSEPTNSKMLKCIECGKYYRNQYSLHHHICLKRKDVWRKGDVPSRMIDGHLTYFCPICYKPFKWLGNLTRHFYVHTGQRFFKCNMCDKEFFSAYQVKRHMNSHTGVRYKCEICERAFTCKYACAWHTRQHHTNSTPCST